MVYKVTHVVSVADGGRASACLLLADISSSSSSSSDDAPVALPEVARVGPVVERLLRVETSRLATAAGVASILLGALWQMFPGSLPS